MQTVNKAVLVNALTWIRANYDNRCQVEQVHESSGTQEEYQVASQIVIGLAGHTGFIEWASEKDNA